MEGLYKNIEEQSSEQQDGASESKEIKKPENEKLIYEVFSGGGSWEGGYDGYDEAAALNTFENLKKKYDLTEKPVPGNFSKNVTNYAERDGIYVAFRQKLEDDDSMWKRLEDEGKAVSLYAYVNHARSTATPNAMREMEAGETELQKKIEEFGREPDFTHYTGTVGSKGGVCYYWLKKS